MTWVKTGVRNWVITVLPGSHDQDLGETNKDEELLEGASSPEASQLI